MTARAAIGVSVALLLASCGSDTSTSSAPPASTTSTTSTAPASTTSHGTDRGTSAPSDDRLGLQEITEDIAALPTAAMADGGCGWTEEAYLVSQASAVFAGRPILLGESGMTSDALGRIVEIDVTDVYVDDGSRLEPGQTVGVFVADTLIQNGYRVAVPSVDADQVMTQDVVTVFGVPDDSGNVRPMRVFSETSQGLSLNGYCDHELDVFVEIADRLSYPDALSMLVEFAEANARGDGIAPLSDAFEQWRNELDDASSPAPWEDQDPATRRLDPQTIPSDLLSSLDVVGVSFALDDLGDAEAVGARTESGVSWSLIGADSLPFVGPLYFLRDIDETVEVFVQSVSAETEPQVVGNVQVSAILEAGGGVEITGSVREGTVAIATLTPEQIAGRLGVEPEQLDQLRENFLAT